MIFFEKNDISIDEMLIFETELETDITRLAVCGDCSNCECKNCYFYHYGCSCDPNSTEACDCSHFNSYSENLFYLYYDKDKILDKVIYTPDKTNVLNVVNKFNSLKEIDEILRLETYDKTLWNLKEFD